MNGLILLGIGLTALTGSLCTLMYMRVTGIDRSLVENREQCQQLKGQLFELIQMQKQIQDTITQLSMDVLYREIYQGPGDRHQLAIKAAKQGEGLDGLMQRHGLSADEASLILSLHAFAGQPRAVSNTVQREVA